MPAILYEDDDILAVDKPAGLATIPERQEGKECLWHQLTGLYSYKIYVVHRLDKEVSGVILFAKNPLTHRYLNEQFTHRRVNKIYSALVHGNLAVNAGEINVSLRQYGSGRVAVDQERGKECLTMYRVQERYKNHTLVTVSPLTGRRHQIRVHFYSIGHPVVGDLLYGDKKVQQMSPRLMLHASKIEFKMKSGIEIHIESHVPELFLKVLELLK
jgi:tRNA pseudouridine32 synthase/23S rRNA pseudouridine746 synthase